MLGTREGDLKAIWITIIIEVIDMNGFAQKEKWVCPESDRYEWVCPAHVNGGGLYSPLISKMINLSQAMSMTQHLKSKGNVYKRKRNVLDARRKVANHVTFRCLPKQCKAFPL